MLLLAAGCSAAAAALFLVLQVERGATTHAVWQYVFAALLCIVVPAGVVVAWRAVTPWRGFVAGWLSYTVTAAVIGSILAWLLLGPQSVA